MKLTDFRSNTYSQFGEDGILQKIFAEIGVTQKTCAEIGAWDGLHLSNTAKLRQEGQWHALLIEADEVKFNELRNNMFPNDQAIMYFVNSGSQLGFLIREWMREEGHSEVDYVSIDVDDNDLDLFQGMAALLRPRVATVEFNPMFPPHIYAESNHGSHFGCSALAIKYYAEHNDYTFVAANECNAFLVRNDVANLITEKYDTVFEHFFDYKLYSYYITDYVGNGNATIGLHPYGQEIVNTAITTLEQ